MFGMEYKILLAKKKKNQWQSKIGTYHGNLLQG